MLCFSLVSNRLSVSTLQRHFRPLTKGLSSWTEFLLFLQRYWYGVLCMVYVVLCQLHYRLLGFPLVLFQAGMLCRAPFSIFSSSSYSQFWKRKTKIKRHSLTVAFHSQARTKGMLSNADSNTPQTCRMLAEKPPWKLLSCPPFIFAFYAQSGSFSFHFSVEGFVEQAVSSLWGWVHSTVSECVTLERSTLGS